MGAVDDKAVIVTGASSGIGAAIAVDLAENGARVLGLARDADRLAATAAAAGDAAGSVETLVVDLADDEAVADAVAEARDRLGRIDGVVHSAGVYEPLRLEQTPIDVLDRHLRVNVRTPYVLTQLLRPDLVASRGAIVFISSVAGQLGFGGASAYCASKGAIELLTRSLAAELAPEGVRANAIAPGWISTAMTRDALADETFRATVTSYVPLGRIGVPADVASLATYLLSDAASYVTGESIRVDGGYPAAPVTH